MKDNKRHKAYQDMIQMLSSKHTDEQRRLFLSECIQNENELLECIPILLEPHPINMRFAWFLGDLAVQRPDILFPHLNHVFINREQFGILNFNRSLAKFFLYCGVPNEIEAAVIDALFNWLIHPKSDISTKVFSLKVLIVFSKKYPEIEIELISTLKHLLEMETKNSFYVLVNKYLKSKTS